MPSLSRGVCTADIVMKVLMLRLHPYVRTSNESLDFLPVGLKLIIVLVLKYSLVSSFQQLEMEMKFFSEHRINLLYTMSAALLAVDRGFEM